MKYRAHYFYGNKLVNTAVISEKNKESLLESLKQSMFLDSTEKLSVELYPEQKMRYYMSEGFYIKVSKGFVTIEKEEFKKEQVRVNWMNDLNISAYYNEEEVQKIQENLQAMMDFVPQESQEDILDDNGEVIGQQAVMNEFVFPHEIEQRFKEITSNIKEKKKIEDIFPIEIIKGLQND